MRFITALASLLLTSFVVASPGKTPVPRAWTKRKDRLTITLVALTPESSALETRTVAERDELCQVGVPCIVSYEVNVALTAVNDAVVLIKGSIGKAISPTDKIVVSLNAAVKVLVQVLSELQVEVGALSGELKVQLQAYVVAAISVAIGQIRAGVAIVLSVAAEAGAIVTPKVTESANAILSVIVAIEVVVGPCVPPSPRIM